MKEISIFKYNASKSTLSFVRQVDKLEVADKIPIAHNSCRAGEAIFHSGGRSSSIVTVTTSIG